MKRFYCLADAHLGEEDNSYNEFILSIEKIPINIISHFIVLGDLFKFFIGIEKWITAEQKRILEEIYKLKKNGVKTIFIEGNRDFFLEEKILSKYFDFIGEEFILNYDEKKFLFIHGDKINKKDIKYLFWNKFSKSFFLYFITKKLPKKLLFPFYVFLEKSMRNMNFKYRGKIPFNEINFFANSLKENFDYVIFGHFHKSYRDRIGQKELILLPAFKDTKEIWYFEYGN